ncbi:MAG: CPBP family intramembrane metalloprotease, partial [Lachnospiraceae bacterium]|nr:CPBP family intramembrane metalloprotease [Lachnospiraceae bacterium]
MLKRYINFLKKSPIITATICIIYVIICFKSIKTDTNFQFFIVRTMLCGAVCFFLYQISGDKALTNCDNSTGYVLKYCLGFLILSALFGSILIIAHIEEKTPFVANPLKEIIIVFLMYMSVGLFEELAFRAVINDAIIYKFRNWKYVFVLSAIVSSIVFGAVHIIGFDMSSPTAWGQAIGKTAEAGLFGFGLLILYWKTRNIWACAIAHGLNDFFVDFQSGLFVNEETSHGYIYEGDTAIKS